MRTVLGVKAIIAMGPKIWGLVEPDGRPDLPGGRVEEDEDLLGALEREVFEETGLSVEIPRVFLSWSFEKRSGLKIFGSTFLCRYVGGKVRLSHEHRGYFWADKHMVERLCFEGLGRLGTYLNGIESGPFNGSVTAKKPVYSLHRCGLAG